MQKAAEVLKKLQNLADPIKAKNSAWFFKTGPGQYGEGDVFIGLTVPQIRSVVKGTRGLALSEIEILLHSPLHECRLAALLILVKQYEKGNESQKKGIYDFYLNNTKYINNWDLVDSSAAHIIGTHLANKPRKVLEKLAKSSLLWDRRIAMISTFYFIRKGDYKDAFSIATLLLSDKEDLMHKAIGWMLREIGKNCGEEILKKFLAKHYSQLPRTCLRYAIERFPANERKVWLKGPSLPYDPRA